MIQWTRVIMLAALMLCMASAFAGGDVIVSVSPSATSVDPGQTFSVNIRIDDAYLLHGSSIVVRFDNSILALVDAVDGDVYPAVGPDLWFTTPTPPTGADSVKVDQAILGYSVFSGSGTLFSLSFMALAPGTTPITLSFVDLRNNSNQSIAYDIHNGSVTVTSLTANIKAFLQGPFSSGAMTASLATLGIIPLAHPYSGAPWSYSGSEAVATVPSGVVDWVLVELRTGTAAATKVAVRAAFIKTNGMIVDLDGTSAVGFAGIAAGSYYVIVRHRNHLAVMSAGPVVLSTTSELYDFTTGTGQYYGSDAADLGSGTFGLYAGDVTADGIVKYNQGGNDRLPILSRIGGVSINAFVTGYYPEDVNMNGIVRYNQASNDRLIILQVIGGTSLNATRVTKVPN